MTGDGPTRPRSGVQRFFSAFVSARTFAAMEAESRSWILRCPDCGHERSIWDMGGIRYKAAGKPRKLMRCPSCGKATWHTTTRRTT